MTAPLRRVLVLVGPMIAGGATGGGFDKAGMTPDYDGDMTIRGLVAGLGIGLFALAFIKDDDRSGQGR